MKASPTNIQAFAFLLVLGCSGTNGDIDAGTAPDAGTDAGSALDAGSDAGSASDAGSDAGSASDAGSDAGSASDAGSDAGSASDAGSDAGSAPDAGTDAGACSYLDLDIWIADCTGGYAYVRRWTDTAGSCPDYFTVGTTRYATLADALSANGCAADCLRAASTSVTLLRCGRRTGYIVYRDADMSCADVYETPDGLFESVEDWNTAHPCP